MRFRPVWIIPSTALQVKTQTPIIARKRASCPVLQLSARISSPGWKVSASTSHTAPRWVPILAREKRSSYFPARESKATIVGFLASGLAVRLSPQKQGKAAPIEQVECEDENDDAYDSWGMLHTCKLP